MVWAFWLVHFSGCAAIIAFYCLTMFGPGVGLEANSVFQLEKALLVLIFLSGATLWFFRAKHGHKAGEGKREWMWL